MTFLENCILAVASAKCEGAYETLQHNGALPGVVEHEHAHDSMRRHPQSACSMHLQSTFDEYSAYLENAKCICQSVLNRGLRPSCCAPRGQFDEHKQQSPDIIRDVAPSDVSPASHKLSPRPQSSSCCQQQIITPPVVKLPFISMSASCCSGSQSKAPTEHISTLAVKHPFPDVEKTTPLEHVSSVVQGMTCSGCASKFVRIVNDAFPAVSNCRVNFVMGNAEFDLDAGLVPSDN